MRKTLFMALTFSIALFASGSVGQLIAHSQSYGSVAWAQADDSEQPNDASTEPAVTPPASKVPGRGRLMMRPLEPRH